jgi:NADH-quinone oxidoreductase subunit M
MIILLGNIALPLTNGFTGAFFWIPGLSGFHWLPAVITGVTVLFGAVYFLRMYLRTMLGNQNELTRSCTDITLREVLVLAPFVVMIFWIGLFPGFFLHLVEPAIKDILQFAR